ncbi:NnrS family protein [Vannielia litorea]|uniref:NnrS family protein n=1 Tax=Vannielia litorea TaxID=1217970 RepID=UPI001BCC1A1B|nr:NnrS family protein [Vannielia litorea]MBS8228275.1 short-chain dehydrogenase [Vannielia litorea]
MVPDRSFRGPALFSYGFRPFFLAATLFGLGVIPLWWLVWEGRVELASVFHPTDWHIHEMIYGYGAAVVAGFLFTAVPNWTGRLPTRGWPLAALLALWGAGRLVVAGVGGPGALVTALVDQAFLLAVAGMIAREIVAGKNWRNLKVLVPVTLLWLANIAYHAEAAFAGTAWHGHRAGIGLLIFLILLIGGRILPSFTRNWLVQRGCTALPVPFNRFDGVALAFGALALASWVAAPEARATAGLCVLAALLHLVRLARWRGHATWRAPILLMLHLAYLFVPLGLAAAGAAALNLATEATATHLLGIGAIGGMTVAVMMRATMGHTGRPLVAGPVLTAAFGLTLGAGLLRIASDALPGGPALSALLWAAAFALLVARLGPMLARPKTTRRRASSPPA